MDDTDAPNTLLPTEAQSLLNVETNINETAIIKRGGVISGGTLVQTTAPVTGSYTFIDKNGNQQVIVCQNNICENSVNGGTFSAFLTTNTAGVTRYQFVDFNGTVYAVDDKNDQPWSYDGTNFIQPFSTGAPLGSIIEQSKDRLIISGVTSNPNGVYYSRSGVFTDWSTSGQSPDPWIDTIGTAGDKVTGMKYDSGNLYIFKRQSITVCIPQDQFSTNCYPISNIIGTNSPASIVSAPDGIYFQSQNGDYWKIPTYGLYGIELISKKISNFVKNQPSQFGNNGNNLQSLKADWDAGNQYPALSWNTSNSPGSIMDSSIGFTDNGNTFSNGTLNGTGVWGNSVMASSNTWQDTFSNGNFTTLPTTWTTLAGGFTITLSTISPNGTHNNCSGACYSDNEIYTTAGILETTGTWKFTYYYNNKSGNPSLVCASGGTDCVRVILNYLDANDFLYMTLGVSAGLANYISIRDVVNNVDTLRVYNPITLNPFTNYNFVVFRSSTNLLQIDSNGVMAASFTDTGIPAASSSTRFELDANATCSGSQCATQMTPFFNSFSFWHFNPYSNYISSSFNTAYSTAIFSVFNVNLSSDNVAGKITFGEQQSTDGVNWSQTTALTPGNIPVSTNTFWRYISTFTMATDGLSISTPMAKINSASLFAATTGQFATQCIQPGPNISSFGTLNCTNSNTGAGSEVFYATSAATCGALSSQAPLQNGWTSQTNNSALTIATNSAVEIGFVDKMNSSTDTAQINTCSLSWSNGTTPQPVYGIYYPRKNSIYWSTSADTKGKNNRILKYDMNLSFQGILPWFVFDASATSMNVINGSLYFGGSSTGSWNYFGPNTTASDNGNPINAYWQSKDFSCNAPFLDSRWQKTFAVVRNQPTGIMTQTFTDSLGNTDTFNINQATTTGLNYVRSSHYLSGDLSPAPFANLKFSNNVVNAPLEVNGFSMDCYAQPPIMENP